MENKTCFLHFRLEEEQMEKRLLENLIQNLEQELLRLGYTGGTITFYRRRWKMLFEFAKEQGEIYFSERLGIDFIE